MGCGPVIEDPESGWFYWLVPPGSCARWVKGSSIPRKVYVRRRDVRLVCYAPPTIAFTSLSIASAQI